MEFQLIAVKCKHWGTSECPHKEKGILDGLLVGKNSITTSNDINNADNICKNCKQFELYKH